MSELELFKLFLWYDTFFSIYTDRDSFSKIESEGQLKYCVGLIRDMNDITLQCKSHYIGNKMSYGRHDLHFLHLL